MRTGRTYIFKDEEANIPTKFPSVLDALQYYQQHLSPQSSHHKSRGTNESSSFCGYCLNDPLIEICAFCGCRKCFGKFKANEASVSCRNCDLDYHTFCCVPGSYSARDLSWQCVGCNAILEAKEIKEEEKEEIKPTASFEVIVAPGITQPEAPPAVIDPIVPVITLEAAPEPVADIVVLKKNKVGRPRGSFIHRNNDTKPRETLPINSSGAVWRGGAGVNVGKVVGVDAALKCLQDCRGSNFPRLSTDQLLVLDQLRLWGPKQDLVCVQFIAFLKN